MTSHAERSAPHSGMTSAPHSRLKQHEPQARGVGENLARQLIGAYEALNSAREQVPTWTPDELRVAASRELRSLSDAMPGVSRMMLIDTAGRVVASSQLDLLDADWSDRLEYREARARANPAQLLLLRRGVLFPLSSASSSHLRVSRRDQDGGGG